jgi:hypothetical protein
MFSTCPWTWAAAIGRSDNRWAPSVRETRQAFGIVTPHRPDPGPGQRGFTGLDAIREALDDFVLRRSAEGGAEAA